MQNGSLILFEMETKMLEPVETRGGQ